MTDPTAPPATAARAQEGDRLLLNAYGRRCYDAGREAADAELASLRERLATVEQERQAMTDSRDAWATLARGAHHRLATAEQELLTSVQWATWQATLKRAEAAEAALAKVRPFMEHKASCLWRNSRDNCRAHGGDGGIAGCPKCHGLPRRNPCSCGLDAVLAALPEGDAK